MKKFIIIQVISLIFAVIAGSSAYAGNIKFVQVTDTHFSKSKEYTGEILENTIKDINKLKGVSFVVFTGDNLARPNEGDLIAFVRMVNKLNVPYYLIVGDHDLYKQGGMSKANFYKIVKDNNILYKGAKPNYVFKKNGFVFIIVDGAKEVIPGSIGYYKDDTLKWLDSQLTKYEKEPVIILQHFPIVEPKEHKSHRVYQPEKYFAVLEKHNNVIAIISGHYHINGEKMENGIYHISTPTLLSPPNYYKIIDIVTTPGFSPMIYTELRPVKNN